MHVYCTAAVEDAAQQLGLTSSLANLVNRLRQGDPNLLEQLFDIRYPYWKRSLRNNIRLLGELRWLDGVPILVLFGLWGRSSQEYRDFLDHRTESNYKSRIQDQVGDEDLRVWLQEQQQQQDGVGDPPDLPQELYGWTQFLLARDYKERLVLESGVWVEQIRALTPEQQQQTYRAVMQLVDDAQGIRYQQLPEFHPGATVKLWTEETVHLAVSLVKVEGHKEPFPFLIGVYNRVPTPKERFELGKCTYLFGSGVDQPDILKHPRPLETWKRYARRAYPHYMLGDERIWLEMQAEAEGNLALSMEEEAVLQENAMPLLINGRAGSGKSLMLYYRFADYCSYYLKAGRYEDPKYRPLFLTYSPALVQQARDKVSKILRASHLHRQEQEFSAEDIAKCQDFFSTFQEYLLKCLPPERQERYQPDRYINFYQFRRRYSCISNKVVDAELAWHTIRTLIKGYEVSEYLDPEGYRELPQADRTVEDSVFEWIYKKIWPSYLELTKYEGYWDDQDLVRDVLENGTLQPIHPVIFCDEVQDFTQIELSVILCLSPWGNFKLNWHIQHLPYAFAGDPLQTINPTGFRWSVLKKYLHDHIQAHLLPNHHFEVQDPQELHNNYRCNPHITRFSNVVNLWRRILSNEEVSPQRPWRLHEQGTVTQTFILGSNLTQDELQRMLNANTGTVCILPCSVGEELDYVRQDPHLEKIFAKDLEQNRKPPMLQTVTAVKGMEFKKIILYKFGDYYRQNFNHNLTYYTQGHEVPLKLCYFLNQLYVGITRPIEALALVDTKEGKERFWDPALDRNFWLERLESDRQKWDTNPPLLDHPVPGGSIQIWTDENLQDVAGLAVEFLKRGVAERDLEALTTAQAYARQLGNSAWLAECGAWRAKVEGQYLEAGQKFLQVQTSTLPNKNPKREAWECFWKGKAWSALQQHRNEFEEIPDIPDYSPLVELMALQEKAAEHPADLLFRQVVRVRDWLGTGVIPKRWDSTWKSGMEEFLRQLEKVVNSLESFCPQAEERSRFLQETCAALAGPLTVLDQRPELARQRLKILGTVHFYRNQFEEAIAAWEQGKETEHSLYYRAKVELEPIPGKLKWLSKDRQDREVVRQWQEAGSLLEGEWQEYTDVIITSLERLKEWPPLLRVLIYLRRWKDLWQVVQAHPQAWRRGHDYELVASMARDPATDWRSLNRDLPGLRPFVQQVLASLEAEYAWLSQQRILELGLAYERLGSFQNALNFYDRFTEAQGRGEITSRGRSQIRQRWLITCVRYLDDLQSQRKPTNILAERFQERKERWREPIPQTEPELPHWHPWSHPLVEHPSPVQAWLERDQTNPQVRLRVKIQQALERLDDRQLQQVYDLIQRFQPSS